eukprot:g4558.t1
MILEAKQFLKYTYNLSDARCQKYSSRVGQLSEKNPIRFRRYEKLSNFEALQISKTSIFSLSIDSLIRFPCSASLIEMEKATKDFGFLYAGKLESTKESGSNLSSLMAPPPVPQFTKNKKHEEMEKTKKNKRRASKKKIRSKRKKRKRRKKIGDSDSNSSDLDWNE